jgi:hypothetical protein
MNWFRLFNLWSDRSPSRPRRTASGQRCLSRKFGCEELEPRTLPASTISAAFGAGFGGGPEVTVRFDDGSRLSFFAFDPSFTGGVSVALGKVNGSAVPDVVVGAGRGVAPRSRSSTASNCSPVRSW